MEQLISQPDSIASRARFEHAQWLVVSECLANVNDRTDRAFSLTRGQQQCKLIFFFFSKESIYVRKELNFLRSGLGRQHGRRFIDLEHQHGGHSLTYVFWCNI